MSQTPEQYASSVDGVVDPCDHDGLRRIPVEGSEGDAFRTDGPLSSIAAREGDGDVRARLRVEHHRELVRPPLFGGRETGLGRNGDAGRLVIDIGDLNVDEAVRPQAVDREVVSSEKRQLSPGLFNAPAGGFKPYRI